MTENEFKKHLPKMRRYRGYCEDLKKWIYGDLIHFSNGNGLTQEAYL